MIFEHYKKKAAYVLAMLLLIAALAVPLAACSRKQVLAAPPSLSKPYLTWQDDPTTTITITWHSEEEPGTVIVLYGTESEPDEYQYHAAGRTWQIPGLPDGRYINSIELTALAPGQEYFFCIGNGEEISPEYKFRTIPADAAPLRFATGGDTLATTIFRELVIQIAAEDPLFLLIGGDLAYSDGDIERIGRWDAWFDIWHDNAVTSDGCLIPLVLAIGNHETNKLEGDHETRAPFFFGFFPQGGKTYWSHQFGANLGLIILDSSHLVPHAEQAAWLEEQLKSFSVLPFRAAVYHVPLYPSHRDYNGSSSVAGREYWLPLFDAYNLSVGFENHDHTFKRTKRLRNNEVDPNGTLYVGDGNAGVMPRVPKEGLWYMEKVSRDSHFWIVDVSAEQMHLRAINRSGVVFDEAVISANPASE